MSTTHTANPAYAAAMRDLRRSSAAGIHADRRTRLTRTRATSRRESIRDSQE